MNRLKERNNNIIIKKVKWEKKDIKVNEYKRGRICELVDEIFFRFHFHPLYFLTPRTPLRELFFPRRSRIKFKFSLKNLLFKRHKMEIIVEVTTEDGDDTTFQQTKVSNAKRIQNYMVLLVH